MIIGCVKEIKKNENRVGLTPAGAAELVQKGHTVFVQTTAGEGSGFEDKEYTQAGATILPTADEVWNKSEMIIHVKEPLESEYKYFRPGLIIYTYFHLAPEKALTKALLDNKVTAIAFETVELADGSLPLLAPMSEVAGRMSVQVGARLLEKIAGGSGKLLGGVPGVEPSSVVIIGGGVVGTQAAKIAIGMGAEVTILDVSRRRLGQLDDLFNGRVKTLVSNYANLSNAVKNADLLIGGVLVVGATAPKVVSTEMVKSMKKGSVIVDVAIDQGGCIQTIDRITYHDNPTYVAHGVVHYSVANMPGAVPRTSTMALASVTLPYAVKIAENLEKALKSDPALAKGVNTYKGKLTNKPVALSQGLEYTELKI